MVKNRVFNWAIWCEQFFPCSSLKNSSQEGFIPKNMENRPYQLNDFDGDTMGAIAQRIADVTNLATEIIMLFVHNCRIESGEIFKFKIVGVYDQAKQFSSV